VHHIAIPDGARGSGDEAALLLGQAGRAADPRQAVLLQQPVDRRARQAAASHRSGGFEQLANLTDRAARVVALRGKDRGLNGLR